MPDAGVPTEGAHNRPPTPRLAKPGNIGVLEGNPGGRNYSIRVIFPGTERVPGAAVMDGYAATVHVLTGEATAGSKFHERHLQRGDQFYAVPIKPGMERVSLTYGTATSSQFVRIVQDGMTVGVSTSPFDNDKPTVSRKIFFAQGEDPQSLVSGSEFFEGADGAATVIEGQSKDGKPANRYLLIEWLKPDKQVLVNAEAARQK